MPIAKPLWLQPFAHLALNMMFPPRCLICGESVGEQGTLCQPCWKELGLIYPPYCHTCGHPLESATPETPLLECGKCIAEKPPFTKARAVFRYNASSRPLVTRFKYSDKTHAARHLGHWLIRAGADILEGVDIITPVPLHRIRLFLRQYNQSALLAQEVAHKTGLPYAPMLLLRKHHTPPQASLTRKQRLKNVHTAFTFNLRQQPKMVGKTILLVDDVMTTGATTLACCRALLKGGAKEVRVLTLGRTVEGENR